MELFQKTCPGCRSTNGKRSKKYMTRNHGSRHVYPCAAGGMVFSETKNTFLEGLKTPLSQVWQVLEARTEGMGLNAVVRVFKYAKTTVFVWERKGYQLKAGQPVNSGVFV
jgi:transposase-like protein